MTETNLRGEPVDLEWGLLHYVIEADDPRFTPTRVISVNTASNDWSIDALVGVTEELRIQCGWGLGALESYELGRGGIGASGMDVLNVTLGAIGTIPTVRDLLKHLGRRMPDRPRLGEALYAALWAIVSRYTSVDRAGLAVLRESQQEDHWAFTVAYPETGDLFDVEIYGSAGGTTVHSLTWTNGDPMRLPGKRNGSEPPADSPSAEG